jgi:hypothetical protein
MNIRPLKDKVILKFDEPEKRNPKGIIWYPDEDYIKVCDSCGKFGDALENSECLPRPINILDKRVDKMHHRGYDTTHQTSAVTAEVITDAVRGATILESRVRDLPPGSRVMLDISHGHSMDPDDPVSLYRTVHKDAIPLLITQED